MSTTAHKADGSSVCEKKKIYIYIYELFGKKVRARGGLEVASGGGWGLATEEEEPSVSLQTPPRVAYFKCSLVSSATADTGPQGKLERNRWRLGGENQEKWGEGDFKNRKGGGNSRRGKTLIFVISSYATGFAFI